MRHRGYFGQRGYGDLLRQIEDRTIAFDDAESAFELANYSALAREVFRGSRELAGLTGEQLLTIQSQFRECDKRLSRLQREVLARSLRSGSHLQVRLVAVLQTTQSWR